jgi:hypothetical protein
LHDHGQYLDVGLRAQMEAANRPDEFIPAGLAAFGVQADEIELAVIGAAHSMFWPPILELLELETGAVAPERAPDLSRAPLTR